MQEEVCLFPYLQKRMKRGNILKSKSDRLTFAFQRGWLWRDKIGSWAAITAWQYGRGGGRGPLSPDILSDSQHGCVCVFSAQVCICVGVWLSALCVHVSFSIVCVSVRALSFCACLSVCLHTTRLSWQLSLAVGMPIFWAVAQQLPNSPKSTAKEGDLACA